jgi:predicted ribosome quality control (RQC) complex YloA/Tae2 family protein
MKIEKILIQRLDKEITFIIGKNKSENFEVIDMGSKNDLWFHADDISSCHVICLLSDIINIDKKDLRYVIKTGALLCKNNTNKLKSLKNVEIIYTQIKNITKTDVEGCVITQNTKSIIC